MSIKAVQAVWEHSEQVGSRLLVLLAIADYAKDDGSGAWPDVDTLAQKSRLSDTMTRNILKELVEDGEIVIHEGEGPRGTNLIDLAPRLMSGKTKGPQRKTRPKNGTGKGWKLPEGNPYLPEGNTGLEIRVSTEEIRVSQPGNTGFPSENTGSPNPSLNRHSEPSDEPSLAADAANDPTPPRKQRRPKTSEPDAPDKPKELTPQQVLVKAFGGAMHINPTLNAGKIARLIADLRKSGPDPTPALVEEKYTRPDSWHYRHDWRGKQGQPPNLASIRESWGVWAEAAPPSGNGKTKPRRVLGPSMLDLRREREAAAEAERRKRHGIPNDDNGPAGHLRGAVAI